MYQQALIPDIYWFLSCQWELYWKRKALLVFNAVCTSHTHFTVYLHSLTKTLYLSSQTGMKTSASQLVQFSHNVYQYHN